MFSTRQHRSGFGTAVLALLSLGLLPSLGRAGTIVLRNDTGQAVAVQITTVVAGKIQRTPMLVLNPRSMTRPITLPGNMYVVISDAAQTTRIFYRDTLPANNMTQAFSIWPNPPGRVKLQPIQFPGR